MAALLLLQAFSIAAGQQEARKLEDRFEPAFLALSVPERTQISSKPLGFHQVFGRRACKFRPLPENLAEGYATPGGFAVSETYGVPLAVLLGAGPLGVSPKQPLRATCHSETTLWA